MRPGLAVRINRRLQSDTQWWARLNTPLTQKFGHFPFAYNAIGIPVAAGVLYPTFGILLSPVVAALTMSLSSVSVIANALRLRAARL